MHCAAENGMKEIIEVLAKETDINVRENLGRTAIN